MASTSTISSIISKLKPMPGGIGLGLLFLATGFFIGWKTQNATFEHRVNSAADSIAATHRGIYIPEFRGVIYLHTTDSSRFKEGVGKQSNRLRPDAFIEAFEME